MNGDRGEPVSAHRPNSGGRFSTNAPHALLGVGDAFPPRPSRAPRRRTPSSWARRRAGGTAPACRWPARRRIREWPGPSRSATASSSSSSGTHRLTRPHDSAVRASIGSPVSAISSARLRDTARPDRDHRGGAEPSAPAPRNRERRPIPPPPPGHTSRPAGSPRRWRGRGRAPRRPGGSTGSSS